MILGGTLVSYRGLPVRAPGANVAQLYLGNFGALERPTALGIPKTASRPTWSH